MAWGPLMRLGLQDLGLKPAEFWALTPAELMLMAGLDGAVAARPTRAALGELMRAYPDTQNRTEAEDG
nr:rcc01693 family protein [Oceanibium sediminis]